MTAPTGSCWLCGKIGPLTKEHIPPKKAFNDCPLLLHKVAERSRNGDQLEWELDSRFSSGMWVRSLCQRCNNHYGQWYGPAYVDLVKRVAERIGDIQTFHTISLLGVRKPLEILKQVVMQFVSANGVGFVKANDWVAPFIRNRTNQSMPDDVRVYLFASNMPGARKSGVSAYLDFSQQRENVLAEFSFWPLGTVMSWNELTDRRLTPIHQWKEYQCDDKRAVDLHLTVNPIASEYPIDFRTTEQIVRQQEDIPDSKIPTESALTKMIDKAVKISGGDGKDRFFSGHPSTADRISRKSRR